MNDLLLAVNLINETYNKYNYCNWIHQLEGDQPEHFIYDFIVLDRSVLSGFI